MAQLRISGARFRAHASVDFLTLSCTSLKNFSDIKYLPVGLKVSYTQEKYLYLLFKALLL